MFNENEEYEDQEFEESEEFEDTEETEELEETAQEEIEDCGCRNFGNMGAMKAINRMMNFTNECDSCECYDSCFEETYGETEETQASIKRNEDLLHIETFLNGLPKERFNVDFAFSKMRKIIKIGELSHGVTIPKILNQVYPRGSEVLTFWSGESKTLLFFGISFIAEQNRETLKTLFLNGFATFRNVVFVGKLNVVVIPRQFMQYFNAEGKVNPQFDSSANVLFFKTNLSEQELFEVDREKQARSYLTHSSISKANSKRLGYEDSEEFLMKEKFRTEGLS